MRHALFVVYIITLALHCVSSEIFMRYTGATQYQNGANNYGFSCAYTAAPGYAAAIPQLPGIYMFFIGAAPLAGAGVVGPSANFYVGKSDSDIRNRVTAHAGTAAFAGALHVCWRALPVGGDGIHNYDAYFIEAYALNKFCWPRNCAREGGTRTIGGLGAVANSLNFCSVQTRDVIATIGTFINSYYVHNAYTHFLV